jgi:Na+-driven multidrug efflux pump
LLNTLICFSYIIFLERRNDTNLHLRALRKINFKIRDYSELFALGLPSFVRNVSMAIAATIQVALLVSVVDASSTSNISEYQSVYGAVNAISNLFWTALFGIINGARIICSYNYGARNFKRVRGSYWVLIIYALMYTGISFSLVCYGINTFLLNLFDVNSASGQFNLANYILKISILQMAITAVGIGGMMIFQATGR